MQGPWQHWSYSTWKESLVSKTLKQTPPTPEGERGRELFPFMAQDRCEFGECELEVFSLSISACNLIREIELLFLGLAKEEKKKKAAGFLPVQPFPFVLCRKCVRWRSLTRREVRK